MPTVVPGAMSAAAASAHPRCVREWCLLLSSAGLVLIGYESLIAPDAGSRWIGDILFLLAALTWAVFGLLMRRWAVRPQLAISGVATFSMLIYMPVYLLWLPQAISVSPAAEIALQAGYQGIVAALLAGQPPEPPNDRGAQETGQVEGSEVAEKGQGVPFLALPDLEHVANGKERGPGVDEKGDKD